MASETTCSSSPEPVTGAGVREAPNPVLRPKTDEAARAIGGGEISIRRFPFRIGRECRVRFDRGHAEVDERRKGGARPNNDFYILDTGSPRHVSRQHLQIEKTPDGAFELLDRGSRCGTSVGGQMVGGRDEGGRIILKDGDIVKVGTGRSPFVFEFSVSGGAL